MKPKSPAENVAVNLLVDAPDLTVDEIARMVEESSSDLWDDVTRSNVAHTAVAKALRKLAPPALRGDGGDVLVYHATDSATAAQLLRRGFIPETKPRARSSGLDYAPGRGMDDGLYVGASPRGVESYGRAILEIAVPRSMISVPSELRQLGQTDPMRALKSHDGAVINERIAASAFRLVGARGGGGGRTRRR